MTRKGPLITLLGGGALAAVLLAASINAATGGDDQGDGDLVAGGGPATEEPTPDPTEELTPDPTEELTPDPTEVEPITYVGYVDGGGASVAIVVTGDEATAYVCDGATVEAWLRGPAANGELVLDGDNGDLVGSYDDESAEGQTTVGDQSWTFTVELVEQPEGLYAFANTVVGGATVEGAWILLPDGTQVGVATVDGESGPAPAIDPQTGEVLLGGQVVRADRVQ